MSEQPWKALVKRYAKERQICNCGEAYYTNGQCAYGCQANLLVARDEIAKEIVKILDADLLEQKD